MVLPKSGRVGRRRVFIKKPATYTGGLFFAFHRPLCYFEPITDWQDTPVVHCNFKASFG